MSKSKEQINGISGNLELDSPSACSLITRYLDPHALAKLSKTYTSIIEVSCLNEQKISRTAGVRFNPLPARIIYILIAEAKCHDLALIDLAVKGCLESRFCSLSALASIRKEEYVKYPYLAAFVLDSIRHLHMSEESKDPDLRTTINGIKNLSDNQAFAFWPKLNSLISNALEHSYRLIKV